MTLGQNSPGRDLKTRYMVLGGLMLAGLLVLSVRTYRLQVTRYDEYSQKSAANFVKEVRLRADRGNILDASGATLAENRPSFDLFLIPAFCQKCEAEVLPKVAGLLGWDGESLKTVKEQYQTQKRNGPFQPTRLKVDLSPDELSLISAHLVELPGIDVQPVAHRQYLGAPERQVEGAVVPPSTYLSHVIGYLNEITQEELDKRASGGDTTYRLGDYIGRRGLERFYEPVLRGTDGWQKEVVNARGETLPELSRLLGEQDRRLEPTPGSNLQLSIDLRLEQEAERVFPGRAGAVVMVEVNTGFILTMLSRPGYDANMMSGRVSPGEMAKLFKDPLQPMVFRPVAQHYPPGSTFKVVTALAALRSGQFTPKSSVTCGGGYHLGPRYWRCWNEKGHGFIVAKTAIQQSCDTYYYHVADVLGLDPISRMGRELGLGQPTGIGVVAEVPGIMPDSAYHDRVTPGGYTKGLALNSAIGQGDDNVTPLQLAMLYATLANGGTLYRPQLVRRVVSVDGKVEQQMQPQVARQLEIDPEHRALLVEGLTAVVNEAGGTAYHARLPDILVAGKTGTAQVRALVDGKLRSNDYFSRHHAWFASFAPADKPEVAVVVLNEHGGHGGAVAAPTA
ncbi:MAG TPA: penicillin-binding protein 2, partial [Myxococcales bacterium]|nr:penicillin-binding protein 2 [Myxococcales bacterium]